MPLHLVNLDPHQDAGQEVINLRSVRRRSSPDRRQAVREGDDDRRSGEGRRIASENLDPQREQRCNRPAIDRVEQLSKLCGMQDSYYGVRVTRARCQPAIKLLDVVFSFNDAPSLPLPNCTETCTCQYQGVRNRRCGPRRLGPPDRRKNVREDEPVRRSCQGRRHSDSGFVFYTMDK